MDSYEFDWDAIEDRIEDKRLAATDGRIQRTIKPRRIPAAIRDELEQNYRRILRHPYLLSDVESYSLTLRALDSAPTCDFSVRLLGRLRKCRPGRRCRSLVCPICRHDYRLEVRDAALSDFQEGDGKNCFMVTIIHGVGIADGMGGELRQLDAAAKDARRYFRALKNSRVGRWRGFRVEGAMELDVYTMDELRGQKKKFATVSRMLESTGDVVVVLSSHILVRARDKARLDKHLRNHHFYPDQVRVESIGDRASVRSHVKRILQYAVKAGNLVKHKQRSGDAMRVIQNSVQDDVDIVHGKVTDTIIARAAEDATIRYYARLYQHFGFRRLRVSIGRRQEKARRQVNTSKDADNKDIPVICRTDERLFISKRSRLLIESERYVGNPWSSPIATPHGRPRAWRTPHDVARCRGHRPGRWSHNVPDGSCPGAETALWPESLDAKETELVV